LLKLSECKNAKWSSAKKELAECLNCSPVTMRKFREKLPPSVTHREASAAGLVVAFLLFGTVVGAFVLVNAFRPVAQAITKTVSNSADSPKSSEGN
jgi:hypothetical protein